MTLALSAFTGAGLALWFRAPVVIIFSAVAVISAGIIGGASAWTLAGIATECTAAVVGLQSGFLATAFWRTYADGAGIESGMRHRRPRQIPPYPGRLDEF